MRPGTILTIKALVEAAWQQASLHQQGSPAMVRPELHYVPRPYMDSTGYKEAVREVHEGAQPSERKHERSVARRGPDAERPGLKRVAA
jgi:hypothetical protein